MYPQDIETYYAEYDNLEAMSLKDIEEDLSHVDNQIPLYYNKIVCSRPIEKFFVDYKTEKCIKCGGVAHSLSFPCEKCEEMYTLASILCERESHYPFDIEHY